MGHLVAHFCKACPFRDNVRPNIRYYIVTTIWRRNSGLYRSTTTDHSVRLTPQIGKGTQSPTEFLTSNVKKKPAKREKDTSVAKRTSTKQQKHPPSPPQPKEAPMCQKPWETWLANNPISGKKQTQHSRCRRLKRAVRKPNSEGQGQHKTRGKLPSTND